MIEFSGESRLGEKIVSNCIIQKQICEKLYIYLGINGKWILIKNETLKVKL